MIRCVAYCRVSTEKLAQLKSLDNQDTYFEREISRADGYKYIGTYTDEGLTGTKLNNRPQFNQLLNNAGIDIIETYSNNKDKRVKKKHILYEVSERNPMFDEIWIKNTSRFARNTLSFAIISKLREKGVNIRFIEQNINTKDMASDFLLKLFQLFDEQDSKDKGIKVKTGIIEGAKKGVINANNNLYGYSYSKTDNSLKIIIHEAKVIKKIYELYIKGMGIRRIINYLTVNNKLTRGGKPFCKSSIKRILTNEKYEGLNVRMKYDTGNVFYKNSYPKIRPQDQWIINESDRIPQIISKEQFGECQSILGVKVNYKKQVGIYKGTTDYAGLIFCRKCGKPYNSNMDRGKRFYNCSTKKREGTKVCNNPNVSITKLEEAISNDMYISLLIGKSVIYIRKLRKLVEQLKERLSKDDTIKVEELKCKLISLEKRKKKNLDMFEKEYITDDKLDERLKPIMVDIKSTNELINALSKPNDDILKDIVEVEKTIQQIKSREVKSYYDREEILADIEKIIIYPNAEIQVIYKSAMVIRRLKEKHDILDFTAV